MLLILVLYNFIALALLFAPSNSIKLKLWNLTPYDYAHIMGFPNNLNKKSLLNEFNRNEINSFLNKNINKNLLNVNFWNQKLIIENYDKEKNKFINDFSKFLFFFLS